MFHKKRKWRIKVNKLIIRGTSSQASQPSSDPICQRLDYIGSDASQIVFDYVFFLNYLALQSLREEKKRELF